MCSRDFLCGSRLNRYLRLLIEIVLIVIMFVVVMVVIMMIWPIILILVLGIKALLVIREHEILLVELVLWLIEPKV